MITDEINTVRTVNDVIFLMILYLLFCTHCPAQLNSAHKLQPAACVILFCTLQLNRPISTEKNYSCCSMRALCSWVSQVQKSSTHAAGCSMRTLCSWAKILRNITSRLARQRTTHAAPAAWVEKPHH